MYVGAGASVSVRGVAAICPNGWNFAASCMRHRPGEPAGRRAFCMRAFRAERAAAVLRGLCVSDSARLDPGHCRLAAGNASCRDRAPAGAVGRAMFLNSNLETSPLHARPPVPNRGRQATDAAFSVLRAGCWPGAPVFRQSARDAASHAQAPGSRTRGSALSGTAKGTGGDAGGGLAPRGARGRVFGRQPPRRREAGAASQSAWRGWAPRLCRADAAFAHFAARPDPRRVRGGGGCRQQPADRIRAARPAHAPLTSHVGGGIRSDLPAVPTRPARCLSGSADTPRQDARTDSLPPPGAVFARGLQAALRHSSGAIRGRFSIPRRVRRSDPHFPLRRGAFQPRQPHDGASSRV